MSDDKFIFGISVDPLKDRAFGFVKVEAIFDGRRLRTDFEPFKDFPTEGNVFVPEALLPDTDTGAVWRVRRSDITPTTARHAAWSAIARGTMAPLEVVSLPLLSSHGHLVKQQLIKGVHLGFIPSSRVLVRLHDGVTIGPVAVGAYEDDESEGMICTPDAFIEPLRVWDQGKLDTFLVDASYALDRRRRMFLCDMELPASQRWLDLADFGDAVRGVLKPLATSKGLLTSAQLREISSTLRSDDYAEAIRERVNRVRRAVQSLSITAEETEGLMPAVLANPAIEKAIQDAKQSAGDQERQRIAHERQGALDEVRRLKDQESQLKERVRAVSAELANAKKAAEQAAETAANEVKTRIEEAMAGAGHILAQVALLRPFLATNESAQSVPPSTSTSSGPTNVALHARQIRKSAALNDQDQTEPEKASDLVTRLAGDMRLAGLNIASARALAGEIVATLLLGQMPIFTGSFAGFLAEVATRSVFGRAALTVEIPVGLMSDVPLLISVEEASVTQDGLQRALLIKGLDRSALEIYGGVLREAIAERVLSRGFDPFTIGFLGSACGGSATLPIGPHYFEVGPVIDTDLLSYSPRGGGPVEGRAPISLERWRSWRSEVALDHADLRKAVRRACIALSENGSILWMRGAEAASGYLASLGLDEEEALESVLVRWVVPRALSEGIHPDEINARLQELDIPQKQLEPSEGADPPIARMIGSARRALGASA